MTIAWCIAIAWLVCVVGTIAWLWQGAAHAPELPYPELSCRAARLDVARQMVARRLIATRRNRSGAIAHGPHPKARENCAVRPAKRSRPRAV